MTDQTTKWPGFKYEPVMAVQQILAARQIRTARKNIQQVLDTMGLKYSDLAERLRTLRRNSRLNFLQKRNQFQTILDTYSARITGKTEAAATEATPVEDTTAVVVPDYVPEPGEPDRPWDDPVPGVSGLETPGSGD
jgi:molybdopterin-biosynthesis enzyme MoeA-like protein